MCVGDSVLFARYTWGILSLSTKRVFCPGGFCPDTWLQNDLAILFYDKLCIKQLILHPKLLPDGPTSLSLQKHAHAIYKKL